MAFSFKEVFSSLQTKATPITTAVGIDIGRSSIKVVELERSEEAPILKTYGEIQIGPYAQQPVGASIDLDYEVLKKAIVDVMRESGVSATHGVLSLPLTTGFVTAVSITVHKGDELASRIPVEARKYIPLPLQEITLDWAPIGEPVKTDNGDTVHSVLLVALQNESVLNYKILLEHLELSGQPMELSMFSAARAVGAFSQPYCAVIDMGASVTKLYIYQAGTVAAIHRFSAGGTQVTSRIAELLSLDTAAAEALKQNPVTPEHMAEVKRVTASVYDGSLNEIRRVIQQFETSHSAALGTIFVAGGVGGAPGVEQYVGDVLQRPVTRAFPFAQVGYPAFMEDILRTIGPTFTNSLGAALRQLS